MASLGKSSARNTVKSGKDIIDQSSHILSIPDTFLALLPAFDALVPDILQFTFPPLNTASSQLVAPPATRFHNHLPTAIDEDLLRHSVPDASICQSLQVERQSLRHLDELKSVLHYVKNRRDCLRKRGIPRLLEDIATARITIINPIKPGTFVWIMSEKQLVLGRVIAIYIKEGGYNGMNLWVPQTPHLGHISYIAAQIYQKVSSRAKYRATHLGRPMEIAYYQLVPTSELLMCVGFVNMPRSDVEEVELKDRQVVEEREELVRLLPELEKAGIPRVGSKTGTEL